jgi:hypothetical protein
MQECGRLRFLLATAIGEPVLLRVFDARPQIRKSAARARHASRVDVHPTPETVGVALECPIDHRVASQWRL